LCYKQDESQILLGVNPLSEKKSQSEKFKDAARELGCDEDEGTWKERLKKTLESKPESKEQDERAG
jgi:hypothetical protein